MPPPRRRTTVYILQPADRPSLQLQWIDPVSGRRKTRSAYTADPREAEKARADLEYEINHGQYREPSRMAWPAFRELVEAELLPGKRPNTQKSYRYALDLWERHARPGNVASLTTRAVSTFLASLRATGLVPTTAKVVLSYLRAVCRWAHRQGLLAVVPDFPTVKVPRRRPQPVAPETFERLLDAAAPDRLMQVYLLCGWLAGLRLTEAALLEWEPTDAAPWLDFSRRRIILPAALVKADEDQWVPLDPVLQAALESLPRDGPRVFRFTGPDGRVITPGSVGVRVLRLARRAGVKLSMKSLRRGFGCRYAGKVPAQVLRKLMRHSDLRVTLEYYVNVDSAAEAAVFGEESNNAPNAARKPSP